MFHGQGQFFQKAPLAAGGKIRGVDRTFI